jgi:hypothetical protein
MTTPEKERDDLFIINEKIRVILDEVLIIKKEIELI